MLRSFLMSRNCRKVLHRGYRNRRRSRRRFWLLRPFRLEPSEHLDSGALMYPALTPLRWERSKVETGTSRSKIRGNSLNARARGYQVKTEILIIFFQLGENFSILSVCEHLGSPTTRRSNSATKDLVELSSQAA
jgi:hypothetical protein